MTSGSKQDEYHHNKLDRDKPRFSLVPTEVLEEIIRVLEYGAKKYCRDSWQEVPDWGIRDLDSAMRHIMAWQEGETNDTETGFHHLAHAICQLMFIVWFQKNYTTVENPNDKDG